MCISHCIITHSLLFRTPTYQISKSTSLLPAERVSDHSPPPLPQNIRNTSHPCCTEQIFHIPGIVHMGTHPVPGQRCPLSLQLALKLRGFSGYKDAAPSPLGGCTS